jgi:uncharacterized protein
MEGVIDCDIHPFIPSVGTIFPYLTESEQRLLEDYRDAVWSPQLALRQPRFINHSHLQLDATLPDGRPPASDPQYAAKHMLDPHGIETALLLPLEGARVDCWSIPDHASVALRGYNRLILDTWANADPRYRMAMVVSPLDSFEAAEQIRIFGREEKVVAIWLPFIDTLAGDRHFWPIYAAAQETNLPIVFHPTGSTGDYVGAPAYAGGNLGTRFEHYTLLPEFGMSNLTSLLGEGVFERFSETRFLFAEWGYTWLAAFEPRWNSYWERDRDSLPYLKKRPSDYVTERVRFSTQPVQEIPDEQSLRNILTVIDGENRLVFASDYPHWDAERPESVFKNQSPEFRRRIFRENAIAFFGERMQTPVPAAA